MKVTPSFLSLYISQIAIQEINGINPHPLLQKKLTSL